MGGTIFISYRRREDGGTAHRLRDELEPVFGAKRLFMDVDQIPLGADFEDHLTEQVAACDVLLALIGPLWFGATDAEGRRRLDQADDYVRFEIAAALAQGKLVIPVLIDDAVMPPADGLPAELKPLVRRQAARVVQDGFKPAVARLSRALERALAGIEAQRAAEEGRRRAEDVARRQAALARRRAAPGTAEAPAAPAHREEVPSPRSVAEKEFNGAMAHDVGKRPRRHTSRIATSPEPRKVDHIDLSSSISSSSTRRSAPESEPTKCSYCRGTGYVYIAGGCGHKCYECNGTGTR